MATMNPDDLNLDSLTALAWRRPLTPEERARAQHLLREQPAGLSAFEEDQELTRLVQQLPDAPVPSNFTACVLQALDQPEPVPACGRSPFSGWLARLAAPRIAWAVLAVLLLPLGYLGFQSRQRTQIAASIAQITRTVSETGRAVETPPLEILRDFEAIDRLRVANTVADEELLAALESPGI